MGEKRKNSISDFRTMAFVIPSIKCISSSKTLPPFLCPLHCNPKYHLSDILSLTPMQDISLPSAHELGRTTVL